MSRPGGQDGADGARRPAHDAVLPRLSSRSGAAPAAGRSGHEHGMEAAKRFNRAGPSIAEAIRHPCRPAYLLLRVPPMSAAANTPPFDLDRVRAATAGGSRRFWSSLDELLDEGGFRQRLAAEFPAA